jgi:hypothetical protein
MITKEYLEQWLTYDNGRLLWKVQKGYKNKVGKEAGFKHKGDGYWRIELDNKSYKRSRLVFLMFHGYLPKMVDHINGVREDDRVENLRAADALTNAWNAGVKKTSTLKVKGVSWHSRDKVFQARIRHEGKEKHLGVFDSLEEAEKCVREFREKHHKEFTNHGT